MAAPTNMAEANFDVKNNESYGVTFDLKDNESYGAAPTAVAGEKPLSKIMRAMELSLISRITKAMELTLQARTSIMELTLMYV